MDAEALNTIVLGLVVGGIFFYVLYGVVRAAVRDGIQQAQTKRDQLTVRSENTAK
ncbi:hypothetical protein GCM10027404_33310 [Arthrobacter tumbae]|nr:hypothetical protein [Arthrobacter tumbae]